MPLLDTQKVLRGVRALMILGLAWEVIHTIKYPWHSEEQADAYFTPAWRLNAVLGDASNKSETLDLVYPRQYTLDGIPIYSSTNLLQRCQSSMHYNINSAQYETGPMSVWSSAESIVDSDPAAAWATWQEIFWTAKNPWGVYWARSIALLSWHITPTRMLENLQLLEEAVPVLIADPPRPTATAADSEGQNKASSSTQGNATDSREQAAAAAAAWWDTASGAELAVAATLAAMNGSAVTSSPGPDAAETFGTQTGSDASRNNSSSNSSSKDDAEPYRVLSRWIAHCNASVNPNTLKPINMAFCAVTERGNASHIGGHFHITPSLSNDHAAAVKASEARLFGVGPIGSALQQVLQWLDLRTAGWVGFAVRLGAALWHLSVPFGSTRVLQPMMRHLAVLELEYEWAVLLTYVIVVLAVFRSWLYLACVAYKVMRRQQLLAFHNLRDRFTGAFLTIFGMILGMWQHLGYGMMDLAIDVLLMKFMMSVLEASDNVAVYIWSVSFEWGMFELRALMRCWKLAKGVWADVKNLVMDPQAILLQQPAMVEQHKNKVNTIGPWPAPLTIPDEIDDLPNSDIPRGFICPITQSIMRQPALLLHDQTITPSSYEKEAIAEWLATHSSDPKTPGRQLRMKSVKLVYNGDLARAIEDWTSQTAQRTASQQRQFAFMQQFRVRAQEALFQRQQQHQQQEGGGTAAQEQTEGPNPFVAAAATAAGAEGVMLSGLPAEGSAPAAVVRGDATRNKPSSVGVAGTATHLMRQSSAAIATVASLDIPTVATAGLAALADTTHRITTRAAARRLAQQQQHQHHAAAGAGSSSSSSDLEQESPMLSPLASPQAAAGTTRHISTRRSTPDVSPGAGHDRLLGSDSDGEDIAPRRSLRVRRRTATPVVE